MINKIIGSYVNKLTKNDIKVFALNNNVNLTDNETNIIYQTIKQDWEQLLRDPNPIFNKVKSELNPNTYNKIIELYSIYKKKLYR